MNSTEMLRTVIEATCERASGAVEIHDWERLLDAETAQDALFEIDDIIDRLKNARNDLIAAKSFLEVLQKIEEKNNG